MRILPFPGTEQDGGKRAAAITGFFLSGITERQKTGGSPFCVHFEMTPARLSPEMRELLVQFPPGTLRPEIGIQKFNGETAAETLRFPVQETRAIIHADLIAGLPGENAASFGAGFGRLWQYLARKSSRAF